MNDLGERVFDDFHDNRIHGFRLISEDFRSEIEFDIDHIILWPDFYAGGSEAIFEVAKAALCFHIVTDINISLRSGNGQYAATAGEIVIDRIERVPVRTPIIVTEYYLWKIHTNHDGVVIEFGAKNFSLEVSEKRLKVPRQHLTDSERSGG